MSISCPAENASFTVSDINKKDIEIQNGRLVGVDQTNRSDFVNARIQLFTFFETIPDVAERRTRVISPLLLGLYE